MFCPKTQTRCREEDCAWWHKEEDMCSIRSIACGVDLMVCLQEIPVGEEVKVISVMDLVKNIGEIVAATIEKDKLN